MTDLDLTNDQEYPCDECGAPTRYTVCWMCMEELDAIEHPEPDSDRTLGLNRWYD